MLDAQNLCKLRRKDSRKCGNDLLPLAWCAELNECELGFHDCAPQAQCVNLANGYECVCPDGWKGLGRAADDTEAPAANGRQCIGQFYSIAIIPCSPSTVLLITNQAVYLSCEHLIYLTSIYSMIFQKKYLGQLIKLKRSKLFISIGSFVNF